MSTRRVLEDVYYTNEKLEPTHKLPIAGKKKKSRKHKQKYVKRRRKTKEDEVDVDMTEVKEAVGFSFEEEKNKKQDKKEETKEETVARHNKKVAEDFLNTIKENVATGQDSKRNHNSTTKPKPGTVLSPQLRRVICRA